MKNKIQIKVPRHPALMVVLIIIIAFGIFQGFYDWHMHQENSVELEGQPLTGSLIDNAINNLYALAPVDATTGAVYFPDVKLTLPAPSQNYALREIESANESYKKTFHVDITSRGIISQAENKLLTAQATAEATSDSATNVLNAIFRQVPDLQACAQGVQLYYSSQSTQGSSLVQQFTKKLASGNTVYEYTDSTCTSNQLPALVNYVKQIQSY